MGEGFSLEVNIHLEPAVAVELVPDFDPDVGASDIVFATSPRRAPESRLPLIPPSYFNDVRNVLRSLADLDAILDSTVKYDSPNRKITFLMTLLNYTEEDQQNIAYNAESSTGKSYTPLTSV